MAATTKQPERKPELTAKEAQLVLEIINQIQIPGAMIDDIYALRNKLMLMAPQTPKT